MTSSGIQLHRIAMDVDGILLAEKSRHGLEGDAEDNILSVGETTLYSATMVCVG